MKRLYRFFGVLFVQVGLWCHAKTAGPRPAPAPALPEPPARARPPIIVDDDTPIDFSWMPQEWQRLAVGSLSILAPMRQRRARA